MALTLEQLRARAKAQTSTSTNTGSSIFSFSKTQSGDTVKIRFVADGDDNDVFWRPISTRTLRFNSIRLADGSVVNNTTYVSVPAFNLKKGEANVQNLPSEYLYYSNEDVIQTKIKPLWDGTEEGRKLYNSFGRKERHILQGFIHSEGYEPKLYRFIFNKELFELVKSFVDDEEISSLPTDVEHGRDFILKVGEKMASIDGTSRAMKDYSKSKWSSVETPLTAEEREYLANNGAFVLKNFIPTRPNLEQEKVMLEMFNASYNGEPYDVLSWGNIFKPDNIFFDENGNIKDVKGGDKSATSAPRTEIPHATVRETVTAQPVQPVQTVATPVQTQPTAEVPNFSNYSAEQLQAMMTQMAKTNPSLAATIQQSAPRAPELISEHSEDVKGETLDTVIDDLVDDFHC